MMVDFRPQIGLTPILRPSGSKRLVKLMQTAPYTLPHTHFELVLGNEGQLEQSVNENHFNLQSSLMNVDKHEYW